MTQPLQKIAFDKIKLSRWTVHVNAAFPSDALESLVSHEDFDGVRGPFEEVIASKFARVHKGAISFNGQIHNLYVKQFLYRSPVDFLKHILRHSRAMRSLNASRMLAAENLLTPEVIAMGQLRKGPFVAKSFLITRSVENAPKLSFYISEVTDLKTKKRFIHQLAETIGKMHAANISHGDLRTGNILVKPAGDSWDFYFLDNERTIKYKKLPEKLRFKNLVQLNMLTNKNLTNADRARFYKTYLKQNQQAIPNAKDLARSIIAKTNERLEKKDK
ncbi:MAG: lipopolysaccharide kinase InaA family protein [Phycisphaerae bacterium]|nr:lipopolysaccharide kinase InaA family protein [Phycisphaerae bacterium]